MEEQETKQEEMNVLDLNVEEQTKWAHEQNVLGRTYRDIASELEVNDSTLKSRVMKYRKDNGLVSTSNNQKRTPRKPREPGEKMNSPISTQKNTSVLPFSEEEIKTLKRVIKERESDIQLFNEYRIYKELERVPVGAEQVRSAFNMSKETTEKLKHFSSIRRIPLQDLVELAVLDLLEKYDKS